MENKLAVVSSLLCILLLSSVSFVMAGKGRGASPELEIEFSKHPVYSRYNFDTGENVINFGTQPLYLPTSLITETMKRDRVLRRKLSVIGMEIHWYSFLKGHDVNVFLKKGAIHGGVGGDMPAINASATMDVVIPAMMQYGFTSIIARGAFLVEDLKGKRIAYAEGSNAHFALLETLSDYGIDLKEVSLVPMEVNEMKEALRSGRVDAFSAWEPVPYITTKKVKGSRVLRRIIGTGYIYFLRGLVEKHPEAVAQIIASEIRAITWLRREQSNLLMAAVWAKEEMKRISGSTIPLSPKQVAHLSIKDILGVTSIPLVPQSFLKEKGPIYREFQLLKSIGKMSLKNGWERVRRSFDNKIIRRILANMKNFKINTFEYEIDVMNEKQ